MPTIVSMLQAGQSVDLVWLMMGSVATAEIAAAARPAAIALDLQHGLWSRESMEYAIGAARGQTRVLVRVADNAPHAVSQALDAGADSVLIPLVETAEQAARAVEYSRYPPGGARSAGGIRPLLAGVPPRQVNEDIAVGVMIETVAGVARAEAIAATPGLDFVFIGTGDLGFSRAGAGDPSPEGVMADCERVRQACAAHGLPCGMFTFSAVQAGRQRDAGYALTVIASDVGLFREGLARAQVDAGLRQPT